MPMKFQVVLESVNGGPNWVIARIPFDPVKTWPERTKLRVRGRICPAGTASKRAEFVTSLIRTAELGYFLLVTGKMRKVAGLVAGSCAEIELEPVTDESAATPPPELARLLKQDRSVKRWFETLSYSHRKYIADAVAEPKSDEARVRRAEQWVERMMLTMEGEQSPPPILQVAFRRQPTAKAGWEAMTANRRRLVLLAIFSCQSPEAQAKRVEHATIEAIQVANRRGRSGKKLDEFG